MEVDMSDNTVKKQRGKQFSKGKSGKGFRCFVNIIID